MNRGSSYSKNLRRYPLSFLEEFVSISLSLAASAAEAHEVCLVRGIASTSFMMLVTSVAALRDIVGSEQGVGGGDRLKYKNQTNRSKTGTDGKWQFNQPEPVFSVSPWECSGPEKEL